jgi:hypothetical protein
VEAEAIVSLTPASDLADDSESALASDTKVRFAPKATVSRQNAIRHYVPEAGIPTDSNRSSEASSFWQT